MPIIEQNNNIIKPDEWPWGYAGADVLPVLPLYYQLSIAGGRDHTLGVKPDGTVLGCGLDGDDQVSGVSGWSDIVMIACGYSHTIGLKLDGTPLYLGSNDYGQDSGVSSWSGILVPSPLVYPTG